MLLKCIYVSTSSKDRRSQQSLHQDYCYQQQQQQATLPVNKCITLRFIFLFSNNKLLYLRDTCLVSVGLAAGDVPAEHAPLLVESQLCTCPPFQEHMLYS